MKKFIYFAAVLLGCLLWQLFLPGPRVAIDHPYWYQELMKTFFSWPYGWRELLTEGLGINTVSVLWVWPILIAHAALSKLNVAFDLATFLVEIIPIFVAGLYGINRLLTQLGLGQKGKIVGQIFYLSNTYFLLLIDGGQLFIALSYALVPLAVAFYIETVALRCKKSLSLLLITLLVISFAEIRALYLIAILFGLNLLYWGILSLFKRRIIDRDHLFIQLKVAIAAAVVLLGIHAYWLLPSIISKSTTLPSTYTRAQQVDFLSFSSLGHSLMVLHPNWPENIFGKVVALQPEFLLIPFLVFLAPILRRRDKVVGFWLLVGLTGIFLSKGSQEPIPQVYKFLFSYLPGFSLFRDPSKFYFFTAISYSVLIAISFEELLRLAKRVNFMRADRITFLLLIAYFIFLIRPLYLGKMTGLFSIPRYQDEYQTLTDYLRQDKSFSRVFWLPVKPPLGFSSPTHPSMEALYMENRRPFSISTVGTYERLNFLRESTVSGELLDVSGVGYIADPYLDPKRDEISFDSIQYYYKFLGQLTKLPWISGSVSGSQIPLLKTKAHQDQVFQVKNVWWVIGSDDLYNTSSISGQLSKNAFIFADEAAGMGTRVNEIPEAKIILNKKESLDLAASFIPKSQLVFPSKLLDFQPNGSGWWKRESADALDFKEFLKNKYGILNQDFDLGGGWAIAEGNLTLDFSPLANGGQRILLVRALESKQGGKLTFSQNGQVIGSIGTLKAGDNLHWFEVGKVGGGILSVRSQGKINVLNAVAVVDEDLWMKYKSQADDLIRQRGSQLNLSGESLGKAQMSFEELDSSRFKVRVSGLSKPTFVVHSQSYSNLWGIGSNPSLPVYSLLNGFRIEKDGEYVIEFWPQKYVYWGLGVSAATLIVFLAFAIYSRKSKLS